MTHCPQCGSTKIWRDGLRMLADNTKVQRWLCRNCGYRFTDPNHKRLPTQWKNHPFSLNPENSLDYKCQGNNEPCGRDSTALGRAVQTLATVEKENEKQAAGATALSFNHYPEAIAKVVEYSLWLLKNGYSKATIEGRVKLLKRLLKLGADLFDPDSVKQTISKQEFWSDGRKELAVEAYSSFLLMIGGKWDPPKYRRTQKLPFIPTEEELDQLIASCGKKTATFLQLLKETGMRAGEAWNLKWTDLDLINLNVRVTPEKGSNPRILRISHKLAAMLNSLPKKSQLIFGGYPIRGFARQYARQRRRAAEKLGNPRLLQITFHTFRHWKATMEYYKTKDILYVMRLLGHKNIKNTLIYTQLVDFKREDDYICKVATTNEEIAQLIEAGFEYVCEHNGAKFFRKPK
ncbi:MAG: tyrosine-type recombinase/integrase [Candidatus Bathyarchaeota archaeon]|nr:tyrosine-type recombinase/integrase [Candidatus Bathyarchaeota archaeon]